MSLAFVKEREYQQLKDVTPNMASLLLFLKRENGGPVEVHYTNRIGWLGAAVLGANDGILSTTSIAIGVAAASSSRSPVVLAALAGLVAGALLIRTDLSPGNQPVPAAPVGTGL